MHFFLVLDEMDLYNDPHFLDASMPEGLQERGSSDWLAVLHLPHKPGSMWEASK
jgi:hypothetical protein